MITDRIRKIEEKFTSKERERIKDTLYRLFLENNVAVVCMHNDEIFPYTIQDYTLLSAGIMEPSVQ